MFCTYDTCIYIDGRALDWFSMTSYVRDLYQLGLPTYLTIYTGPCPSPAVGRNFQREVRRYDRGFWGAAQGPQKPWGIWCKILQSSNFQALHSNFRKADCFSLLICTVYTNQDFDSHAQYKQDATCLLQKLLDQTALVIKCFKNLLFLLVLNHLLCYLIDLRQKRFFHLFGNQLMSIPLFKKDDPSVLTKYRPVSLLSCVSKIMERIIFKHVYYYFHCKGLFYQYQARFLPGHSTVYQLLETYHRIVQNIDEG